MHVLITGGAGFIGSHLARSYISKNCKVTVVDNLCKGFESNIPPEADFIRTDITADGWTDLLPSGVTHVVHLAAQSSGEISFEDPSYDVRTNTVATLELLNWALSQKIKKFVFSSSMNVYGNTPDQLIDENQPSDPTSFYGVGKVASENYIKIFSELGLDSVILRLFNVYGPGQNMDNMKQGMISIYAAFVANDEPIVVKGDVNRFRDFVYIDDVVDAISSAVQSDITFDTFNVCTGVRTTIGSVLDKIIKAFGKDDVQVNVVGGTPRDQFGVYGSHHKISDKLSWQPKHDLDTGLKHMVSWIKNR